MNIVYPKDHSSASIQGLVDAADSDVIFVGDPRVDLEPEPRMFDRMARVIRETNLDVAQQDQLARLIITAQVGSLLDQRIAQLAVGGQDPGAQSSVRKLIGVRYRQALAEFRMDLADGLGIVAAKTVKDFLNTRCLTIAGGTEQILLTLAGERLLGLPR